MWINSLTERRRNLRTVFLAVLPGAMVLLLFCGQGSAQDRRPDAEAGGPSESFLPARVRQALLELRAEATVAGTEIRLEHIARWSEADSPMLQPLADLVLARFDPGQREKTLDAADVKQTLEDAGMNLASLRLSGAASCKVLRVERGPVVNLSPAGLARQATQDLVLVGGVEPVGPPPAAASSPVVRSLRQILTEQLAARLDVDPQMLQLSFRDRDAKLVELTDPPFRFEVEPLRLRKLGSLSWEVTIIAGDQRQKTSIAGLARMWQEQLVTARPVSFRQVIAEEDLVQRRVLVDHLDEAPPLTKEQVLHQQASRDLPPGTVLTARMIESVQMARVGQLVTVGLSQGGVRMTWVGEAREGGCLGQTIRVRRPGTREEFSVVLTGPQQAMLAGSVPAASGPTRLADASSQHR